MFGTIFNASDVNCQENSGDLVRIKIPFSITNFETQNKMLNAIQTIFSLVLSSIVVHFRMFKNN